MKQVKMLSDYNETHIGVQTLPVCVCVCGGGGGRKTVREEEY